MTFLLIAFFYHLSYSFSSEREKLLIRKKSNIENYGKEIADNFFLQNFAIIYLKFQES